MTKENKGEYCEQCGEYYSPEEMTDLEQFMAMSWGSPKGILVLSVSLSILILSIGGFLWLLHLANIIK